MRKVIAIKEYRDRTRMDHWDEPSPPLHDHQSERDLRDHPTMALFQKADNLLEATACLRKAMGLINDLTNRQELATIVAQELQALVRE